MKSWQNRAIPRDIVGFLVGLALLLASCAPAATTTATPASTTSAAATANATPIKVGIVAPLSGAGAVYGDLVKKGAELAVNEINSAGGVGGRRLQLVYGDDQLKPETGVNETRRLIQQEGANFLIGGVSSGVALAQATTFPDTILFLEAKSDDLTSGKFKNVLDPNIPFSTGSELFFGIVDKRWQPKTIAAMLERSDLGTAQEKAARSHWADKLVDVEYFNLTDTDFSVALTKIAAKKPDTVFLNTSSDTILGQVLRQSAQFGITSQFLLGPGTQLGAQSLQATKSVAGGVYTADIYDSSIDTDANRKFVSAFRAAYRAAPGKQELITYEAIQIAAKAIAQAGCSDCTAKIVDLIKGHSFDTPRGTVTFTANGLGVGDKFFVYQFVDGAPKLIASESVKQ